MFGAAVCVISMGIFLAFSCKANPYVDPINDKMEMVSKVSLIVTPLFVLLGLAMSNASLETVISVLLNLGTVTGNFFMVWLTISAMACCQTKLKKWTGKLAFSSPDGKFSKLKN